MNCLIFELTYSTCLLFFSLNKYALENSFKILPTILLLKRKKTNTEIPISGKAEQIRRFSNCLNINNEKMSID